MLLNKKNILLNQMKYFQRDVFKCFNTLIKGFGKKLAPKSGPCLQVCWDFIQKLSGQYLKRAVNEGTVESAEDSGLSFLTPNFHFYKYCNNNIFYKYYIFIIIVRLSNKSQIVDFLIKTLCSKPHYKIPNKLEFKVQLSQSWIFWPRF